MSKVQRHLGWIALTALIMLGTCPAPSCATSQDRPNFLFIISDDHRWDTIGIVGNPAIHTPVLDQLATEGVCFRQATIHVAQCSPSRSTLITGLTTHQHGWYSNQYQTRESNHAFGFSSVPTMPRLLQQAGYRTVLVGKWHPRPDPWNCGFSDVRVWLPVGGGPYTNPLLARGNSREMKESKGNTQAIFADDAVAFLQSDAATEKPFLLWLAFTAPHEPYGPVPARVGGLYAGKTKQDLLPPNFPKDAAEAPWKDYYAAISDLDEQVGVVLRALQERKLAENTVVVFLGDNGYMMGERGEDGKVVPYESSVRVPFIIRAPKIAAIHGMSDAPVSSLDLPPTFLQLAGVRPPKTWAGRDLGPVLRGEEAHGIGEAFCEFADDRSKDFGDLAFRLVRTPTHKLIVWEKAGKPDELYDLTADPHEGKNLIDDAASAGIRDDLRQRLRAWMAKTADPALEWKK